MDLVWVEQILAVNSSVLRNLGSGGRKDDESSTSNNTTCYLNIDSNKVAVGAGETLNDLNLLKILVGETVLVDVKQVEEDIGNLGQPKLLVTVEQLKLNITTDLTWSLATNTPLNANDSIAIVGQTIQLKISRAFAINAGASKNQIQLALSWTPLRKLISLQAHFYLDRALLQNHTAQICQTLEQAFHFSLTSTLPPMVNTTELSFLSPSDGLWKHFSSLHHAEVIENFADAKNPEVQSNRTTRQISCSRWMLLNHVHDVESAMATCTRIFDGCNLAAFFVDRQDLVRLPNQCLACTLPSSSTATLSKQIARFGSRRIVNAADSAQVVFVVDGSCHQSGTPQATVRFMHQLNRLAKVVEKEFRGKRVRSRFMIITPDAEGKYKLTWPHFEKRFNYSHLLSRDSQLATRHVTTNASNRFPHDPFLESTWPSSGRNSFDFLHLFPYPPGRTSRHFVMIDCLSGGNPSTPATSSSKSSSCLENEVDFSTARTMFLHSNNYLHIISGLGISRRPLTSPKMRRVIGLDWRQVIFDNETAISTANRSTSLEAISGWLRRHVLPHRDICHVLALETNGSLFSHRVLKQANRRLLAKRIVANLDSGSSSSSSKDKNAQCYRCDCMLAKDRLSAHEECILCRDRKHTLLNPYRKGTSGPELSTILGELNATTVVTTNDADWHFDTKQEWTEEDERHFREIHGEEAAPAEEEEEVDE